MSNDLTVSMLGLDTSHTVEFVSRMQSPTCPPDQSVAGMKAGKCLRTPSLFCSEEEQDNRQRLLESWGVQVTRDFDEAVEACDAIMLECNDPTCHPEYFAKCAQLGKPVFIDKPFSDSIANGRMIADIAQAKGIRVFSTSSTRFEKELQDACKVLPQPTYASMHGSIGLPLSFPHPISNITWYGIHVFEMLQVAMGHGAETVYTHKDSAGAIAVVKYAGGRQGIVELMDGVWLYGGCLRSKDIAVPFVSDTSREFTDLLKATVRFFNGAKPPVDMRDTLEVMAIVDAAERSYKSGKTEEVQ